MHLRLCLLQLFNAIVEYGCLLFCILSEEFLKLKEKLKLSSNYFSKFSNFEDSNFWLV